jgi:uncharacterized membrane protein
MAENQSLNTNPNTTNTNPEPAKAEPNPSDREQWRAQRRAWREERHEMRNNSAPWIGGVVLIAIGLFFLLQNFGLLFLHNWWALFIMIPAAGAFASAYAMYRNSGNRLSYPARGSLVGGIFFTLLTAMFLFDLNFGLFWPILLIFAGVGLLLNFILPS